MYKGSELLLDYSATKGAIHAFTMSLASSLIGKGIRVNAVAPGPVWTPLNPADRSAEEIVERLLDGPVNNKSAITKSETVPLWVDRERALFGAWYEFFPRSEGGLQGARNRLAAVAEVPAGVGLVVVPREAEAERAVGVGARVVAQPRRVADAHRLPVARL